MGRRAVDAKGLREGLGSSTPIVLELKLWLLSEPYQQNEAQRKRGCGKSATRGVEEPSKTGMKKDTHQGRKTPGSEKKRCERRGVERHIT